MRIVGITAAALIWVVALASAQTKTVWDGVYSEAQAGRGKKLYIASCAACHQESLTGADLAPALKGDEFLLLWNDEVVAASGATGTRTWTQTGTGATRGAMVAVNPATEARPNNIRSSRAALLRSYTR